MGLLDKNKKKTPRKEYENKINEARKTINKIDIGLGENANKTIKKELNQKLDDNIIEEYGTPEEKQELTERRKQEKTAKEERMKIQEKLGKAKRMNDKNSIRIYNEVLTEAGKYPKLIITAYHGLIRTYTHIKQFDNAISAANECIEFKKKQGMDYSYELRKIEFINKYR